MIDFCSNVVPSGYSKSQLFTQSSSMLIHKSDYVRY